MGRQASRRYINHHGFLPKTERNGTKHTTTETAESGAEGIGSYVTAERCTIIIPRQQNSGNGDDDDITYLLTYLLTYSIQQSFLRS
jgi:hypothetical protein